MNQWKVISENLRVEVPFELEAVTELKLERQFNEHPWGYVRGYIPESEEHVVMGMNEESEIRIAVRHKEKDVLIFCGMPVEIQVFHKNQTEILIKLAGSSMKMDWEKKTRSFQRNNITYQDIISEMTEEYGGDVLDCTGETNPCHIPLIQYEETDWEFIKRVGGICKKPVYPTSIDQTPKVYVGCGTKETEPVHPNTWEIEKRLSEHMRFQKQTGQDIHETECILYRFQSRNYYDLGQLVSYEGHEYCITKVRSELTNGSFFYHYTIQSKQGMLYETYPFSSNKGGRQVQGTILAVETNRMKLHLDMDEDQEEGDAYWYPWHRNDWFCMPEVGEKAVLLLPEADERKAFVTAVRSQDAQQEKAQNPEIKYLETSNGKAWRMDQGSMVLHARKDELYLKLWDDGGISLESTEDILIRSGGTINIKGSHVFMKGREKIWLTTNHTSMVMDEIIQLRG